MTPELPGTIDARYRPVSYIGGGGMADVWRVAREALDGRFRRDLALKLMKPLPAVDHEVFFAEAILASRLAHPNIVQGLDFGAHEKTYFLVMELVEGVHLGELAKYVLKTQSQPLHPSLVAYIVTKLCSAFEYAHAAPHKIVHRDLSPNNVLVSIFGEIKLCDLGIAKYASRGDYTRNQIRGKPTYMSPEQVRDLELDHRSDLFALGTVMYELLSGVTPFRGSHDQAVMRKIADVEFVPLHEVAPHLDPVLSELVHRLMALEPNERPSGAREIRETLEPLLENAGEIASELAGMVRRIYRGPANVELTGDAGATKIDANRQIDEGTWPAVSLVLGQPADDDLDTDFDGSQDLSALPSEQLLALGRDSGTDKDEQTSPSRASVTGALVTQTSPTSQRGRLVGLAAFGIILIAGVGIATLPRSRQVPSSKNAGAAMSRPATAASLHTQAGSIATSPASSGPPTAQPLEQPGAAITDVPRADEPDASADRQGSSTGRTAPGGNAPTSLRVRKLDAGQRVLAPASLEIIIEPWGHVWLDGEFLGLADRVFTGLKPGRHTLAIGQHVQHGEPFTIQLKPSKNTLQYKLY